LRSREGKKTIEGVRWQRRWGSKSEKAKEHSEKSQGGSLSISLRKGEEGRRRILERAAKKESEKRVREGLGRGATSTGGKRGRGDRRPKGENASESTCVKSESESRPQSKGGCLSLRKEGSHRGGGRA